MSAFDPSDVIAILPVLGHSIAGCPSADRAGDIGGSRQIVRNAIGLRQKFLSYKAGGPRIWIKLRPNDRAGAKDTEAKLIQQIGPQRARDRHAVLRCFGGCEADGRSRKWLGAARIIAEPGLVVQSDRETVFFVEIMVDAPFEQLRVLNEWLGPLE